MNLDDIRFYRYFSFDLSIKLLEQYYPKADINKAWSDILKHMTANGFDHRQYSGYLSQNKLDEAQTFDVAFRLFNSLKWLANCAQKFDSTAVLNEQHFDFLQEFQAKEDLLVTPQKRIYTFSPNPPKIKREDLILPKDEKQDFSEMSLTPEQFKKLTESGIKLTVMIDSKDLQKASEILNPTKSIQQAKPHKPKR